MTIDICLLRCAEVEECIPDCDCYCLDCTNIEPEPDTHFEWIIAKRRVARAERDVVGAERDVVGVQGIPSGGLLHAAEMYLQNMRYRLLDAQRNEKAAKQRHEMMSSSPV